MCCVKRFIGDIFRHIGAKKVHSHIGHIWYQSDPLQYSWCALEGDYDSPGQLLYKVLWSMTAQYLNGITYLMPCLKVFLFMVNCDVILAVRMPGENIWAVGCLVTVTSCSSVWCFVNHQMHFVVSLMYYTEVGNYRRRSHECCHISEGFICAVHSSKLGSFLKVLLQCSIYFKDHHVPRGWCQLGKWARIDVAGSQHCQPC